MKHILALASIFIFIVLIIAGCTTNYKFNRAKILEENGYFVEAGQKYEQIAQNYPDSLYAPEALFRVAVIYQKKLNVYSKARICFTRIIENYPKAQPWRSLAEKELINCPDYFPLSNGSFWIEGDSKTGGQNMRTEWACSLVSTGTYLMKRRMFAGSSFVLQLSRYYKKERFALKEYKEADSNEETKILSYPFVEGRSWKTVKDGRNMVHTIVSLDAVVKVEAGTFTSCLKICEEAPSLPGKKYIYYAPGVGWILTTTSAAGGTEFRNSELLSYKIRPEGETPAELPTTNKNNLVHKAKNRIAKYFKHKKEN
jgi:tetratricopeptide (TPR) repeat protein